VTSAGGYWRVAERALALAADVEGDDSLGCWAESLRRLGRLAGELAGAGGVRELRFGDVRGGMRAWSGEPPVPPPDDETHRFHHEGPVVVCSCRWRSDGGIGLEGTMSEHIQRQLNHLVHVLWEERELRRKQRGAHIDKREAAA